jgi:hypothetical protein
MMLEEALRDAITVDPSGCWLWQRSTNRDGYARAGINGRVLSIHRLTYEMVVGPIPDGLQLDHLCRVRNCVNPEHLEPVTPLVNVMRSPHTLASINSAKSHCPKDHEYTEENTYTRPGSR